MIEEFTWSGEKDRVQAMNIPVDAIFVSSSSFSVIGFKRKRMSSSRLKKQILVAASLIFIDLLLQNR